MTGMLEVQGLDMFSESSKATSITSHDGMSVMVKSLRRCIYNLIERLTSMV